MALNVGTLVADIDVDDHGLHRTMKRAESRWETFATRVVRVSRTAGMQASESLSMDSVVESIGKAETRVTKFGKTLEKARGRELVATNRVKIAETELLDLRKQSNVSATKLLAAETKLLAARERAAETKSARVELEVESDKAVAELAAFKREAEQLEARVRVDADMSPARRAIVGLTKSARARVEVDADTSRAASQIAGLTRGLGSVAGAAGRAGLIGGVGIAALSSVHGVVALTAALAPLAGGLLVLPGAAMAGGAALGALKVGLSGFGDAMKNVGDPKKFAESIKGMAPAAQQTAVALRGLKPAWDALTKSVQGALFAGVAGELRSTATVLLPALRTGLTQVAGGWNLVAKNALSGVNTMARTKDFRTIFSGTAGILRDASSAMSPLIKGVITLGAEGTRAMGGLGKSISDAAHRFNAWVQINKSNGNIQAWISDAKAAFSQLGSILGSLGSIIGGVFKAMSAGTGGLSPFATALSGIADLVNSPTFQTGLTSFFAGISAGMRGLMSAMPAIGQLFAQLGPVVGQLAAQLGPVLGQALGMVATAFTALMPALQPLISGLMAGLRPVIAALGPLLVQLAVALRPLGPALGQLATMFGGVLAVAIRAVTPVLTIVVGALSRLLQFLAPLTPLILVLVGVIRAWAIAQALLNGVLLANPIGALLISIGLLVAGVVMAYQKFSWFRAGVQFVWSAIKTAVGVVVTWFQTVVWPVIRSVLQWLGDKALWLYHNAIKPAWAWIRTAISVVATWLRDTAWPIFRGVLGWIGARAKWLYDTFIKPYFNLVRAIIRTVFAWLRDTAWPIFRGVLGWIGDRAKWLYEKGIRPYFNAVKTVIRSVFGWIRDTAWPTFRKVMGWIADKAKWLWNRGVKPPFELLKKGMWAVRDTAKKVRDRIGEAWDGIKKKFSGPIAWVKGKINSFIRLLNGIPGVNIPEIGSKKGKKPVKRAAGGPVPGWSPNDTADNIPAMLTAGEHVIRVRAAERMRRESPGALEHINRTGTLPVTYATGGTVGRYVGQVPGVQHFESGGEAKRRGHSWPIIWDYVRKHFSGVRKTSDYRPGSQSLRKSSHALGTAIDIAGSVGAVSKVMTHMLKFGRNMRDLIYTPLWGHSMISDGRKIRTPQFLYNTHKDHGHIGLLPGRTLTGAGKVDLTGMTGTADATSEIDLLAPFRGWGDKIADQLKGKFPGAGIGLSTTVGLAKETASGLLSKAGEMVGLGGDGGGGSAAGGVKRWTSIVKQALAMMGEPASLVSVVLRRMNQESGGNPRAINNWDSNARRGTPSKGLMQVIDPTFRAYRHPKLPNDIWNPLANIVASMRYAKRRYGSLAAAYNRRGGYAEGGAVKSLQRMGIRQGTYDQGGMLRPGYTLAYNGTGRSETIRTSGQEERLLSTLRALADQQAAGVLDRSKRVVLEVHLDGRQLEATVTKRQESDLGRGTSEPGVEVRAW